MFKEKLLLITEDNQLVREINLGENEELYVRNKNKCEYLINRFKNTEEIKEYLENENLNNYYHLFYKYQENIFNDIKSAAGKSANTHIIRFLILCNHLNFRNKCVDDRNRNIKKSDLSKVWNCKDRAKVKETFDLLLKLKYIKIDSKNNISINENIAKKGKIIKMNSNETYTRIFSDNLQTLINNSNAKSQKKLSNLLNILPFINYKYNILCENPEETEITEIIPLTWKDVAKLCNYEEKNYKRLKKDLMDLELDNRHIIGEFNISNNTAIVVNPKIYYAYSEVETIKYLDALFTLLDK